ncbi:MAG: hypothetical protein SGPRY_013829, partial [Prymnesium sp.]
AFCDDVASFAVAACSIGTDCTDCGPRSLCSSCPDECRRRGFRLGRASFCWEHQHTGSECVPACNNWECGYPACSLAQRISQCVRDQSGRIKASLISVPGNASAGEKIIGSIDADARAQLEMRLSINQITINFDESINSMRARIEFGVNLKWRDSRVRTMPCKDLLGEMFKTTSATTDAERLLIDPYKTVLWWPQLQVQGDSVNFRKTSTVKLITSTVKTYADAAANWSDGGFPSDGAEACSDCITQELSLKHEYALPLWEYSAFPFDTHNITVLLGVANTEIFSCSYLLGKVFDRSKLLPTTGEWDFVEREAITTSHPIVQGVEDKSQCELRMGVKRNSIVFLIKQVAPLSPDRFECGDLIPPCLLPACCSVVTSIMVVYAGLCAPFLDVADHTGDRVALILVSALIVVVSFQTDFGLGKISYLMWFDYFNLMQMGVLALALLVSGLDHSCSNPLPLDRTTGGWPEAQRVALNKVGTPALMLGTYPLALCGVFIYGAGYTLLALAVLAVGGVALVVICVLSYRFLVQRTELEQDKLIHRLQRVGVRSAEFMPTLQELFTTVDAEGNNSISIDSVRKFMRPALKHCSAADYSFVMTKASSASSTEISFEALRDAIE